MQAKEVLQRAIAVIRGEAVLYEYNRRPEEIFIAMSEICLLLREYRLRIGHRYIKSEEVQ